MSLAKEDLGLTPREFAVLQMVSKGLKNKEIAREVFLAEKTIEHMLSVKDDDRGIFRKIGVKNRAEAAAWVTSYRLLKEQSDAHLQQVRQVRINGNARLAMIWAEQAATRLQEEIYRWNCSAKILQPILGNLGRILFERLIAHFEVVMPPAIRPLAQELITQIRTIATECGDQDLYGLAAYGSGLAYYLSGQRAKAIKAFTEALGFVRTDDYKLSSLRYLALNWAYLGELAKFKEMEGRIKDLLGRGIFVNDHFICMALEGMGRGQGILKLPEAFDTLEEGWRMYTKVKSPINKLPMRHVQLTRSELEVGQYFDLGDKQRGQSRLEESLWLARDNGYVRYEKYLQNFVNQRAA
ncbi:MAG: hypothetical protein BroJett011_18940 [Chloroflexota bacterium]|nr:MAG: hypothetical protein BroJett011_18940 [Chloroflexota bacterium]